jgi:ankyrin repeat protein
LDHINMYLVRGVKLSDGTAYNQPISAAAEQKPPRVLRWLLDRGLDEQTKNQALIKASASHNFEAIQLLLDSGANPNYQGPFTTPLSAAAGSLTAMGTDPNLEFATVQVLLNRGANPNSMAGNGVTPLSTALRYGYRRSSEAHRKTVRLLIRRGANMGLPDACVLGDLSKVKSLIATGANPNSDFPGDPPSYRQSCLDAACSEGNTDVVRALLKAGANPHGSAKRGSSPIANAVFSEQLDCVKLLVDCGVSADSFIPSFSSLANHVIVSAIVKKNYGIAKYLISRGADVNARNSDGRPFLFELASSGRIDLVEMMIGLGADVNAADAHGYTPLHAAVMRQNEPLIRILLRAGGDPNRKTERGQTAFDMTKRPALTAMLRGSL